MASEKIRRLMLQIYAEAASAAIFDRLETILEGYRGRIRKPPRTDLSERDAILITYPDQVQELGRPALLSLAEFCEHYLKGLMSGIHVLPFYPWSSDDGFSVIDYRAVSPQYGTWKDIQRIGRDFRPMFDAVINHASASSQWFQDFRQSTPPYDDYFIQVEGSPDLSKVVRPRALPLLTRFPTAAGEKTLWTTFSSDQIDLNFHEPAVFLEIVDVLLFYASQGAEFLRLDAVAYLWKETGTSCISLPNTHRIVQLIRAILDEVAPHVRLITETNVPQPENISYYGNGTDEAQLAYNFPLPPLVLHAFLTGSAEVLSQWAAGLSLPSERVTFLNFLASHDGIGLNPLRGILPEGEIEALAQAMQRRGGLISYKSNADGTQSLYELNINFYDALDNTDKWETLPLKVDRFVAAHAILLSLAGLPAIYFHSMFGSRGWPEGAKQSGQNRSINRQKLQRDTLQSELADPQSLRNQVLRRLSNLLRVRAEQPAFSPWASQRVLESGGSALAFVRQRTSSEKPVLCLYNVSGQPQDFNVGMAGMRPKTAGAWRDLITDQRVDAGKSLNITLNPYQALWLTP